ncbi:MAG: hypothetical protein Q9184_000193 [Pyrenodesmia sp. 2 TL-2023]
MPPLGSSVINKSGKKIVPKAPIRRPAAPIPGQTFTPASIAPIEASSTPGPDSTAPAAELTDPASSQAPNAKTDILLAEPEVPNVSVGCTNKRLRDEETVESDRAETKSPHHDLAASSHLSPEQNAPSPVPEMTAHSNHCVLEVSQPGRSHQDSSHVSQPCIPTITATGQPEPISRSSPSPSLPSLTQHEPPSIRHSGATSAKRRKLRPDRSTKPSAPQNAQTSASQRNPTVQVQIQVFRRSANANSNAVPHPNDLRPSHVGKRRVQPAKPTKKSAAKRKDRQHQGTVGGEAGAGSKPDQTRRVRDNQRNTKVRKARQTTSATNTQRLQDAAAEIVADAVEGAANRSKGRRGRKAREPTPEAAENEIIAPGAIKMAELCKDTRQGKKSDTLKALQERDKQESAKEKQRELQRLVEGERQLDTGASEGQANAGDADGDAQRPGQEVLERQEDVVREVADTYVDEQGQIRINTDSLRIDRHAQAAAAREQNQEEAVVENDLSKPAVNSRTYSKREPLNSWPEQLTDEFYEALRTFGTDFGMICRMLRKTRRAVKMKFNREEKADPGRINQALLGAKITIDMDEYSRRAGENIKETEEHNRKMEEDRKKIEEDAAGELRAKEEQEQLRREQVEKERATLPDDSSNKENREASRKRKEGRKLGEKRPNHAGRKKKGTPGEGIMQVT